MIEVRGVSKFFGSFKALDDISFSVRNGEVVGYVGLNGAGKTTTIRIIAGTLNPDSGDVFINGCSITREKRVVSRYIGWVPEQPIFESDARALDYFVYLAGYYGISASEARSLGRRLLDEVGLGNALNMKLKEYSQGMKKRFALAVSMISNPDNYAFDEVLNGLDPQGIAYFRDLALRLRQNGCAVLFSSHILSEVEAIADRVVFIHKGRIVDVRSMDEIKAMANPGLYIKLDRIDGRVRELLSPYGETRIERGYIVIVNPPQDPSEILTILLKNGYKVLEYRHGHSLEDVFFRIIGEKK